MHIDFDLKCPCPVARLVLRLSDPGHATGHAEYPQVRAMPTHVGAGNRQGRQSRRYCADVTATRYTADASSRGNDRVVEVCELVFDVDRVPRC